MYRDADGYPKAAQWGDARLVHQRWQPGEAGLCSRFTSFSYRWHRSPFAGWCAEERCPVCGKLAFLNSALGRFFHKDGTSSRECWVSG